MKFCNRFAVVFSFLLIACLCIVSCSEKKEGKVIVTEQEFSIRHDTDINWVIDVKGKIRNVGEADVKKVVITGYCRDCTQVLNAGIWTTSDYEKTMGQKDVISYLTAGAEEEFSFVEVAFYFHQSGHPPAGLPDMLEVVIESFEVVDG